MSPNLVTLSLLSVHHKFKSRRIFGLGAIVVVSIVSAGKQVSTIVTCLQDRSTDHFA
ncbi:hypothetical protein [Providencia sp. Me31A]|uniref:hypothetical protein n=1 Tax=Providencia sp. Me31A TaxID=3392637 RepID=UPI003D2BCC0C